MRFNNYINEGKRPRPEKSTSAVVNKIAEEMKKVLPYMWFDNKPFRFGLGLLASNKISEFGVPTTCPGMPGVTGIAMYVDDIEKAATVYEITSSSPGLGSKMIEAMVKALPEDYSINIHHDWSSGWWDKIMAKYPERKWKVQ